MMHQSKGTNHVAKHESCSLSFHTRTAINSKKKLRHPRNPDLWGGVVLGKGPRKRLHYDAAQSMWVTLQAGTHEA